MQYLDALEGLRSQGFPDEPVATKRYEILQRFMEGVRDVMLRRELSIIYASEATVTNTHSRILDIHNQATAA